MSKKKLSKLLALYLPYVVIGLLATNLGEAWRLAVGKELGDKIVSLMGTIPAAFANPLPSLHPFDFSMWGRLQLCKREILARRGAKALALFAWEDGAGAGKALALFPLGSSVF